VLFVAAAIIYGGGAGKDADGIVAYYADPAQRRLQEAGFAVLLVGCVCLLHYSAVIVDELGLNPPLSTIAVTSGAASAVLLMAGNALWAATAFAVDIDGEQVVNPSAHLLVEDAAFVLVMTSAATAIPMVVLVTRSGIRQARLPWWFGLLGLLAAIGLVGAYWYIPLLPYLVWLVAGSVLLFLRPAPTRTDQPRPSAALR
jgi:hypothetical protein